MHDRLMDSISNIVSLLDGTAEGVSSEVFKHAWLDGPAAILKICRAQLSAGSESSGGVGLDAADVKALGGLLNWQFEESRRPWLEGTALFTAPDLSQLGAYVRGLAASLLAANAGRDWEPDVVDFAAFAPSDTPLSNDESERTLNAAEMHTYGAAAFQAFSEFGGYCNERVAGDRTGDRYDPVTRPGRSAIATDSVARYMRNLKRVPTAAGWLHFRRVLGYLWGESDTTGQGDVWSRRSVKLMGASDSRGEIVEFGVQPVAEGMGTYIDPIDTGFVLLDDAMRQSLNWAWRCCRGSIVTRLHDDGEQPTTLRLSFSTKPSHVLEGASASGMIALAMYATVRNREISSATTGSFALTWKGKKLSDGETPADDGIAELGLESIGVGPVTSFDAKLNKLVQTNMKRVLHCDGQEMQPRARASRAGTIELLPVSDLGGAWLAAVATSNQQAVRALEQKNSLHVQLLDRKVTLDSVYQQIPLLREVNVDALEAPAIGPAGDVTRYEERTFGRRFRADGQPIPITTVVNEFAKILPERGELPRFVVLGPPGSGKTTLAQWLVLDKSSLCSRRVPLRVRLRDWQSWTAEESNKALGLYDLSHYLAFVYKRQFVESSPSVEEIRQWLVGGEAFLILDGLDEVLEEESDFMQRGLNAALSEFSNCPLVMTCRTARFEQHRAIFKDSALPVFILEALDKEQVHGYITSYPAAKPERFVGSRLFELVWSHPQLRVLATNPMLLMMMCFVFDANADTSDNADATFASRSQLYDRAVHLLLNRSDAQVDQKVAEHIRQIPAVQQREILERTAEILFVGMGQLRQLTFSESQLLKAATNAVEAVGRNSTASNDAAHLMNSWLRRGLLQKEQSSPDVKAQFLFLHLTIQEYLVACRLAAHSSPANEIIGKLGAGRWREPILLALGHTSAHNDEVVTGKLLQDLLEAIDTFAPVPRAPLLVSEALPELVRVPPGAVRKTAERLLDAYTTWGRGDVSPPLSGRIEAAFEGLLDGDFAREVENVLAAALSKPGDRAFAATKLLRGVQRFSKALVRKLAAISAHDSGEWGWPIDGALREAVARGFDPGLQSGPFQPAAPSLRSLLLSNPALVDRVCQNPVWFRLIVATSGGLDGLLPARIRAAKAKLETDTKLLADAQALPETPVNKLLRDELEATKAQTETTLKQEIKSGLQFKPQWIHRDSPLSPIICECLKLDRDPRSLIEPLQEVLRSTTDVVRRRDAGLMLLLLGEPVDLGNIDCSFIANMRLWIAPSIAAGIESLTPVKNLVTAARNQPRNDPFAADKPAELIRADVDSWLAFVHAMVAVRAWSGVWNSNLGASYYDDFADDRRPELLAEVFHYGFSAVSDDPIYNMCVTLDTLGKRFTKPAGMLRRILADAHKSASSCVPRGTKWRISPLTIGDTGSPADGAVSELAAAFEAIAAIPPDFGFVAGWMLEKLSGEARELGFELEALVLAATLTDLRFGTREAAIRAILQLPADGELPSLNPADLIAMIRKGNSSSRFRAFWWVLTRTNFFDAESAADASFRYAMPKTVRPADQLWMLERTTLMGSGRDSKQNMWLNEIEQQLVATSSAEAQAIGQMRLAFLWDSDRERLLVAAMSAALQVRNEFDRKRLLRNLAQTFPPPFDFQTLLREHFPAEVYESVMASTVMWTAKSLAAKEQELIRYTTQHDGDQTAVASGVGLLVLAAVIASMDIEVREDLAKVIAMTQTSRAETVKNLRTAVDELQLSTGVVQFVEEALKSDDHEVVAALISKFQKLDASTIAIAEQCLNSKHETVKRYGALLLAEAGKFSPQVMAPLVSWLERDAEGDDLGRHRAAIALHGTGGGEPRITVTQVGKETLFLAHKLQDRLLGINPQVAQVLTWFHERIVHDDRQLLQECIARCEADPNDAIARPVLKRICRVEPLAWPVILGALESSSAVVQTSLFYALTSISVKKNLPDRHWPAIYNALSRWNSLEHMQFVTDEPDLLVTAAYAAANARTDVADVAMTTYLAGLKSVGNLLNESSDQLRTSLLGLGNTHYVGTDWNLKLRQAASKFDRNKPAFSTLLEWLAALLQEDPNDPPDTSPYLYMRSNLLSLSAIVARRLPEQFQKAAARLDGLPALLLEVVRHHHTFTGREAAISLLGYLRKVDCLTIEALRRSLIDVAPVQNAALAAAAELREFQNEVLPELEANCQHVSANVRYVTAQLMLALSRNVYLDPSLSGVLGGMLAKSVSEQRHDDEVYLLEETDWNFRIRNVGRLEAALHKALIQISGVGAVT